MITQLAIVGIPAGSQLDAMFQSVLEPNHFLVLLVIVIGFETTQPLAIVALAVNVHVGLASCKAVGLI